MSATAVAAALARRGPDRPPTRVDVLRGDRVGSSRATRAESRCREIKAVISEPSDQTGQRRRCGSIGDRRTSCDAHGYKGRNVVERGFALLAPGHPLDKHTLTYRGADFLATVLAWLR
jgi:transposase